MKNCHIRAGTTSFTVGKSTVVFADWRPYGGLAAMPISDFQAILKHLEEKLHEPIFVDPSDA